MRLAAALCCLGTMTAAQDLVETCDIVQSCEFGKECKVGKDTVGIDTLFGEAGSARYLFKWNGKIVSDLRDNDGHIFTWLMGSDDDADQRSFAMSYIYNDQMPDPEVAEFLLMETRIRGRLTDTIVHSGLCRESEK